MTSQCDSAPVADEGARGIHFLHELEVHQIELEMQNESLRAAQIENEKSRDRYVNLYDFAPVGYLTLNRAGRISETNLTAAKLLGVEKSKLIHARLDQFIAGADQIQS